MRIFVAGPFSAETRMEIRQNVLAAMAVGTRLLVMGHQPFVPHLSGDMDEAAQFYGIRIDYERWMEWTLTWLKQCDALFFLGSSPGADRELSRAKELGLPIYYRLDEVPTP